jgi:hypothetical protein
VVATPLSVVHAMTCCKFDKDDNPSGRHHAMNRQLADMLRRLGADPALEPRYGGVGQAAAIGPDCKLRLGDKTIAVDLSICMPMIKKALNAGAADMPRRQLDQVDQHKNQLYANLVQQRDNATFYALAISQNGTRSTSFAHFLKALRQHLVTRPDRRPYFPRTFVCRDYVTYMTYALSVTMLNHTSRIAARAVQWARDNERVHLTCLARMSAQEVDAFHARAGVF